MTFGSIIEHLRQGGKATRTIGDWEGRTAFIALFKPKSEDNLPYIYFTDVHGNREPWVPTHSDILAMDWKPLFHDQA